MSEMKKTYKELAKELKEYLPKAQVLKDYFAYNVGVTKNDEGEEDAIVIYPAHSKEENFLAYTGLTCVAEAVTFASYHGLEITTYVSHLDGAGLRLTY